MVLEQVVYHLIKMRNWKNNKWIFENDGALRDIYVQNTTVSDWEKVIDLLNSKYQITFGVYQDDLKNKIDIDFVRTMFKDETGELETKTATIDLNGIVIKCYFFIENQIEFDITPTDIKSVKELNNLINFMKSISLRLGKQVTLCGQNQPEFPLIKIDHKNGIEKILTKKDAENLWNEFIKSN